MSKVAVVYWSGTGNTEAMANAVADGAKGAGAEVDVYQASDFDESKVADYTGLAFGCPAMGSEQLEDSEFEPMWDDVKGSLGGKNVALFGSYSWAEGEWMQIWKESAEADGVTLCTDCVIAYEYPDDEAVEKCNALGAAVAK